MPTQDVPGTFQPSVVSRIAQNPVGKRNPQKINADPCGMDQHPRHRTLPIIKSKTKYEKSTFTLILSLLLCFLSAPVSALSGSLLLGGSPLWTTGTSPPPSSSSWLWYSELRYRPLARLVRFVPE
jgi:hypothetical protein